MLRPRQRPQAHQIPQRPVPPKVPDAPSVIASRDSVVMLDLILPLQCGGCGAPAARWCPACSSVLAVRDDEPHVITPRVDPGVPVFSLGRYAGPRRAAIVALKEHGRNDLVRPLADALGAGLARLLEWAVIDTPLSIVPAPTRTSAARRRGGDPITRIAQAAATRSDVEVVKALRMAALTRDSVGLSSAARQRNIAGRVRSNRCLRKETAGDVLLVDDVVTTGSTACESVSVLLDHGCRVVGVLAIANA